MMPRSAQLSTAVCLYLAALTAPFWMEGLWCAWNSGGVAGFIHNDDSIAVAVVDTQSTQTWSVQPGDTIPMKRGLYRVGGSADSIEFDPSDTVMAHSLTWVVDRTGLRSSQVVSAFAGLPESMAVVIGTLVVAAAYLTVKHIAGERRTRDVSSSKPNTA